MGREAEVIPTDGPSSMADNPVVTRIRAEIETTPVVAFLNGTPMWPTCSDSAAVAYCLAELGIAFKGIDVTPDPELRDGLKTFAKLADIPQVYVKGTLLGSGKAVRDLAESGQLADVLKQKGIAITG